MRQGLAVAAVVVAVAIATAGCGLGAGQGTSDVALTVTRDFGSRQIGRVSERSVPGSETVMRMLERHFQVATRYGGGFVESIDGLAGAAPQRDWFFYVNGIEGAVGAAGTAVHRGDRVWWDLHDWSATDSIPAVVGSFPEPFLHGIGGKRLPTTLECAAEVVRACARVSSELTRLGVPVAMQTLGTGSGTDSLAIEVGTWRDLRGQIVTELIDRGPSASGVYARFSGPAGAALELLDPQAAPVRTLGAGTGLVAATSESQSEPTWVITGTDVAGVNAAAAALTPAELRNRFAIAVRAGSVTALPLHGAT